MSYIMKTLKLLTIAALALFSCGAANANPEHPAIRPPSINNAGGIQGGTFGTDRRYYAMENGSLEKWDFNKDGSFLHEGVSAGVGTSVRGSERGTYSITGSAIVLHINKKTTAYATPGGNGSTQLGASTDKNTLTRKMSIKMLGKDGENGVVLNGKTFNVRHWE
jgi:hypothetical protein